MPTELTSEHPNLRQAATRLRRTLWIWAALAAGMGLLTAAAAAGGELVPALGWLAAGVLMALFTQPLLLALTAVQWALSLVAWIPGVSRVAGGDALTTLLQPGAFESIGLAIVRVSWRSPPGTVPLLPHALRHRARRRGSVRTCRPSGGRPQSHTTLGAGRPPAAEWRSWRRWPRWVCHHPGRS
jgi:hypothetical protein